MRFVLKLSICIFLVPAGAIGQERILNVTAGQNGDLTRIVVAIIEPSQDAYKMQSMIIDVKPLRSSKESSSFHLDLTSTDRSLSTGAKKQMILLLRWKQTGEIELKCDGKWVKQNAGTALEKIVDVIKAVIQNVPLNLKSPTAIALPPEIQQRVSTVLNALGTEEIPCLRKVN